LGWKAAPAEAQTTVPTVIPPEKLSGGTNVMTPGCVMLHIARLDIRIII